MVLRDILKLDSRCILGSSGQDKIVAFGVFQFSFIESKPYNLPFIYYSYFSFYILLISTSLFSFPLLSISQRTEIISLFNNEKSNSSSNQFHFTVFHEYKTRKHFENNVSIPTTVKLGRKCMLDPRSNFRNFRYLSRRCIILPFVQDYT